MKINASMAIIITRGGVTIEIEDMDANLSFIEVELTPEQWCNVLSGASTETESTNVENLDKVGKIIESKKHEFRIPRRFRHSKEVAIRECAVTCPEGWIPSRFFGSQSSFFEKDGVAYARADIYRYVDKEANNEQE